MTRQEVLGQMVEIKEQWDKGQQLRETVLQKEIQSLKLEVAVLKRENDKLWDRAVNMVTDERLKRREVENNIIYRIHKEELDETNNP